MMKHQVSYGLYVDSVSGLRSAVPGQRRNKNPVISTDFLSFCWRTGS